LGGKASRGTQQLYDLAWHMALPVLVLGLAPALVRHVRASLLEAMDSPFALSARAQGIPRRRLRYRHLLPAALNPLISLFGFSVGTLLSASLLVGPRCASNRHAGAQRCGSRRAAARVEARLKGNPLGGAWMAGRCHGLGDARATAMSLRR
jgi:hypothetical protein